MKTILLGISLAIGLWGQIGNGPKHCSAYVDPQCLNTKEIPCPLPIAKSKTLELIVPKEYGDKNTIELWDDRKPEPKLEYSAKIEKVCQKCTDFECRTIIEVPCSEATSGSYTLPDDDKIIGGAPLPQSVFSTCINCPNTNIMPKYFQSVTILITQHDGNTFTITVPDAKDVSISYGEKK